MTEKTVRKNTREKKGVEASIAKSKGVGPEKDNLLKKDDENAEKKKEAENTMQTPEVPFPAQGDAGQETVTDRNTKNKGSEHGSKIPVRRKRSSSRKITAEESAVEKSALPINTIEEKPISTVSSKKRRTISSSRTSRTTGQEEPEVRQEESETMSIPLEEIQPRGEKNDTSSMIQLSEDRCEVSESVLPSDASALSDILTSTPDLSALPENPEDVESVNELENGDNIDEKNLPDRDLSAVHLEEHIPLESGENIADSGLTVPHEKGLQRQGEFQPRVILSSSRRPKYSYMMLAQMTTTELASIAEEYKVSISSVRRKEDAVREIMQAQAAQIDQSFGGGTLEIMSDGYGFLRPQGLLPSEHDIYMSASQIRRFNLRNGDVVWGMIRKGRDADQNSALSWVEMVNYSDPEKLRGRPYFHNLVPIFPNAMLKMETGQDHFAARLIDLFSPIGLGQRALIVSPPKAGKTSLLKEIARALAENYPEVILMVLLIDERPEEVTDIQRSVDGEVIASTFDRPANEHIRVASLALEKAKRLVEMKKDVVLLLDSITRLTRASNLIEPPSGRTLSGGMDPAALYFPKRFFGAARNIESGGSLTIVGTALVETGSRMDDVIYEEFKGTGNMEVHLSRRLAEQRLFPAFDITKSGTRRDELLLQADTLSKIWAMRRRLISSDETEALSLVLDRLRRTRNNADFLNSIKNV